MLRTTLSSLNEYTSVITSFIKKCIDDYVLTNTNKVHPDQRFWTHWNIHSLLNARSEVFKKDDTVLHKKTKDDLHKVIRIPTDNSTTT